MRPTLSDIQRRIDAITASSQTPFIVFVKAVFEGEEVIDRAVYATVDEALGAFKRAHRITSDMGNKSIVFIDDIPEDEERAGSGIVGYTLEN
jgi:hypothetical protein